MRNARAVAMVGCGYWGKNLVRNFAALGALGAIVDADQAVADRVAAEFLVGSDDVDASRSSHRARRTEGRDGNPRANERVRHDSGNRAIAP